MWDVSCWWVDKSFSCLTIYQHVGSSGKNRLGKAIGNHWNNAKITKQNSCGTSTVTVIFLTANSTTNLVWRNLRAILGEIDHDVNQKGSIILTVNWSCDISGSFYCGQVNVSLKESVFQPSDSHRAIVELICLDQNDIYWYETTPFQEAKDKLSSFL